MSMYGVCTYPIHNYLLILGTYIPERLLQPPLAMRPSSYVYACRLNFCWIMANFSISLRSLPSHSLTYIPFNSLIVRRMKNADKR